jgi:hypothetical protein
VGLSLQRADRIDRKGIDPAPPTHLVSRELERHAPHAAGQRNNVVRSHG